MTERLDRAKQYLVIAESEDSKREAYKAAAEEIAAHIAETGDEQQMVATTLQCSPQTVGRILKWRTAGYPEGTTPFTMADPNGSKPTDRAAVSHTKRVLRESPQAVAKDIAEAMEDPDVAHAVVQAASTKGRQSIETAADTVDYIERKQQTPHVPPPNAASHKLGGIGPGALSNKLHNESMEPLIHKVLFALKSAKLRWMKHGFRLTLTEVHELDELDEQVKEIGALYAEMLDQYEAAKDAKIDNEQEGATA